MVFAIILLVMLAISLLMNVGLFAGGLFRGKPVRYMAREVGPRLEEVLKEDNGGSSRIAVIEINGLISGQVMDQGGYGLVEIIRAQLKRAEEDDSVKAVILKVDSPGGEVLASDEISRLITDFQKKPGKPVIASMGELAASGGYYISAPCRWIVANELTLTGSIGVIMHSWNYRGLMNKVGLRPEVYKSGKFKDMMSGERELNEIPPEERKMMQNLIDETYQKFKEVVLTGRTQANTKNKNQGRALKETWLDYADGRVLSGKEAYAIGFVDQLGNFQDAVARAKTIAGVSGPVNLIEYRLHYDLSDLFSLFSKTEGKAIKIDLGMETPKLQAGRLYYLAPTFLH
jgi:protease-4